MHTLSQVVKTNQETFNIRGHGGQNTHKKESNFDFFASFNLKQKVPSPFPTGHLALSQGFFENQGQKVDF